jgi:hypothetical protein
VATFAVWLSLLPSVAWAGMPSMLPSEIPQVLRLTESAAARYQAISFFLVVLLLSAVVVRWLWNRLSVDFPKLPRLSFLRSLAIVFAWGLLLLVVLTMIAGTRELMTPGVWQKQGLLYHLPPAVGPAKPSTADHRGSPATAPQSARATEQQP